MICIFGLSFVCIASSDNKEDTQDWKYARLSIYGCNRKPGLDFGHGFWTVFINSTPSFKEFRFLKLKAIQASKRSCFTGLEKQQFLFKC